MTPSLEGGLRGRKPRVLFVIEFLPWAAHKCPIEAHRGASLMVQWLGLCAFTAGAQV